MGMFDVKIRLTVPVGHCALVYQGGALTRSLPSGVHRVPRDASTAIVELRERLLALAPQEVLTADSVSLRITLALRIAISDPVAYTEAASDAESTVYLAAQVALRDNVSGITAEEVMRRSARIDPTAILATARTAGQRTGIDVREVFIKDVVVPQEIRAAALELVNARARGAAQLEAARAETAALRALANAGRLLDAHPALAQLKLIQAVPYGSRVALTLGSEAPYEAVDGDS